MLYLILYIIIIISLTYVLSDQKLSSMTTNVVFIRMAGGQWGPGGSTYRLQTFLKKIPKEKKKDQGERRCWVHPNTI